MLIKHFSLIFFQCINHLEFSRQFVGYFAYMCKNKSYGVFQDENRLKVTVIDVKSLTNMQEHNARLITEIKEMAGVGSSLA